MALEFEVQFKEGNLSGALVSLQGEIRKKPADPKLRLFLFQLLCVLGEWNRAHTQLKTVSDLGDEYKILSPQFEPLLLAALIRDEVFAGKRTPLVIGEPAEYVSQFIQALKLEAEGDLAGATQLRELGLESAPARAGTLNGEPFEWLMDADPRLGPIIEAVIDGKYCWLPIESIQIWASEPPSDVRDFVWQPASIKLVNEGEIFAHIYSRYPGTELSEDPSLKLARRTDWVDKGDGVQFGLGQRVFATSGEDIPLLEIVNVTFE